MDFAPTSDFTNDDLNHIKHALVQEEGLRLKVYNDTLGIPTIGVGRNLRNKGISEEEAMQMLNNDIQDAVLDLKNNLPFFINLSAVRKYVLISMYHNMGLRRLLGFKKMLAAVAQFNYKKASEELLDSKAARMLKTRYIKLSRMLLLNKWED